MNIRTLFYSFLTLALLVTAVGCDSSDDDGDSDADVFVGTWAVVGIADDEGDQTLSFSQLVDAGTVNFTASNNFTLAVDYNEVAEAQGITDVTIPGTYVVDEGAETITLNTPLGALAFDYEIVNNDRIRVSTGAPTLNIALGLSGDRAYTGTVTLTVQRT
ncbi:MAG: hypothetical protein R3247_12155 [Rhodothermales bacterium]|nr:hypothetical protein [Rhodothermales bacterium]